MKFVGKSKYMYGLPYIVDMEKFRKYMHETDCYFNRVFNIDLNKQFTTNIVSFFIEYLTLSINKLGKVFKISKLMVE